MAMSRSFRDNGSDEVREGEEPEVCSHCSADGKLQPALHFCFDCGVCGKYMCGDCLRNHNRFLKNHDSVKLANSSKSSSDPSVITRDGHCSAMVKKRSAILVTAIDIGHTSTSCVFSFRHEFANDTLHCEKVLFDETVVLFDANKKFHSLGRKAEEKYRKLSCDGNCHKWYFFRRFMATLRSEKLDLFHTIVDQTGKDMTVIDVVSAIIGYFKDYILKISEGCYLRDKDDIHWVVPVPAIWTDIAKQILREAVYKAGVDDEDLTLVSEPEAASKYCQMLPVDKLKGSSKVQKQTSQYISRPGTKFMVIDLGGNTADFTILERLADGGLTEIKSATGEACCYNTIEKGFLGIILKLLGDEIYQRCFDEDPDCFLELQRDFNRGLRNLMPDKNYIILHHRALLEDILREFNQEGLQEAIVRSQFDGKIYLKRNVLKIDSELVIDILNSYVDIIVKYIQYLLEEPCVEDTGVFLMVGGVSNGLMVQEAIIKAFPNVNVIVQEHPEYAVAKGALIYGQEAIH